MAQTKSLRWKKITCYRRSSALFFSLNLTNFFFGGILVKEEALDAPSLARGSKRSLSGVSPPYAAPLSPKHLRTEAHPSEGTAFVLILIYEKNSCRNCRRT